MGKRLPLVVRLLADRAICRRFTSPTETKAINPGGAGGRAPASSLLIYYFEDYRSCLWWSYSRNWIYAGSTVLVVFIRREPCQVPDPLTKVRVSAEIQGPFVLSGFGTDEPEPLEGMKDMERTLYDGRALLVIRRVASGNGYITLRSAYGDVTINL